MKKVPYRFYLSEDQIPAQWYNLRADMPEQPDPMLNPATMQPAQLSLFDPPRLTQEDVMKCLTGQM